MLLVGAVLAPLPARRCACLPSEPRLYLVTLDGPGTAGYRRRAAGAVGRARACGCSRTGCSISSTPRSRRTGGRPRSTGSPSGSPTSRRRAGGRRRAWPWSSPTRSAGWPAPSGAVPAIGLKGPRRGGAGTVVGVIDTGLAPESPLFAAAVPLGKEPRGFSGGCQTGEGWEADDCDAKVVGGPVVRRRASARTTCAARRYLSAARLRRPRHPDGLDRRGQRRRPGAGGRPADWAATAGWRRRPGSRSTRRAGVLPTPPTTAAPPPTWSPRSTAPPATGST